MNSQEPEMDPRRGPRGCRRIRSDELFQHIPHAPSELHTGSLLAPHSRTMNKRIKTNKLQLNHETVRTLNNRQLSLVGGGSDDYFSKISNCIFNQCVQQ
jgi:hypothetical protein